MELNVTDYEIESAEEPQLKDVGVLRDLLLNPESIEEAATLIESYGAHIVYVDIPYVNASLLREALEETIVCNEKEYIHA